MRYVTLDVFTDTPFGGNPLAVVLEADGLEPNRMQLIAAEFGYSETAFVCAPSRPGFDARVRIFTPAMELGFAGHPNIGTALVLAEGDRSLMFEEAAGAVAIEVKDGIAEVAAPQPFKILGPADPAAVAAACGLPAAALVGQCLVATCGAAFAVAEVSSLDHLGAASPVAAVTAQGAVGVFLYTGHDPIRARMFAPAAGVTEEPATGSAALVLAGLLAQRTGPGSWVIRQGIEMGRPATLGVRADGAGNTWVAGSAVQMMRGSLSNCEANG